VEGIIASVCQWTQKKKKKKKPNTIHLKFNSNIFTFFITYINHILLLFKLKNYYKQFFFFFLYQIFLLFSYINQTLLQLRVTFFFQANGKHLCLSLLKNTKENGKRLFSFSVSHLDEHSKAEKVNNSLLFHSQLNINFDCSDFTCTHLIWTILKHNSPHSSHLQHYYQPSKTVRISVSLNIVVDHII
jgi:hypothetical protein